ncbi:MAG: hypothetical protein Q6366_005130, partial [Candidatus Freyarchaeota archaeon]
MPPPSLKRGYDSLRGDEKWLELNPIIGSGWMPRGEQRRILTPGVNQRINAFITLLWSSKEK